MVPTIYDPIDKWYTLSIAVTFIYPEKVDKGTVRPIGYILHTKNRAYL